MTGSNTLLLLNRFAHPAAGGTRVELLLPPYERFQALDGAAGRDPPFGALAVAGGNSALAMLGALALLGGRWPWLVPVLRESANETGTRQAMRLVWGAPVSRVVVLGGATAGAAAGPREVVAAVCRRAFPLPAELARFVSERLGRVDLSEALTAQFDEALTGRRVGLLSSATYSRLFRKVGPFTARDWRALAVLMYELHMRQCGRLTEAGVVRERTVIAYARRFLGESCATALGRLGWEWVVEAALRKARVPAPVLVSIEDLPT